LSMELGNQSTKRTLQSSQAAPSPDNKRALEAVEQTLFESTRASEGKGEAPEHVAVARQIGEQLVDKGYDRVSTASRGEVLQVRWENNLYNRDERDSILDVARVTHQAAGTHRRAEITLLNQGLPVLTHTVALGGEEPYSVAREFSRQTVFDQETEFWDFEGGFGPPWKPRLTLGPSISSGIATEYGMWDTSVAVSAELSSSLWPGALASMRYDAEVYQTDDFEKGRVFYKSRQRSSVVEAEIQQALKLHSRMYTVFHAGRYVLNYYGGFNETMLTSATGRHSAGLLAGRFFYDGSGRKDQSQALAQYHYYNPILDIELNAYAGRFFESDEGFRVDTRFWFGDYALTLQYKNTNAEFVSLGWIIPLTPAKDHQFRFLQVRGDADWKYAIQTRINQDKNFVSFGGAALVVSSNPVRELYLNRGRFGR